MILTNIFYFLSVLIFMQKIINIQYLLTFHIHFDNLLKDMIDCDGHVLYYIM